MRVRLRGKKPVLFQKRSYAAIFICCVQVIFLRKVIYWQMLHKNSVSREVKRLEVRIVELTQIVREMKTGPNF